MIVASLLRCYRKILMLPALHGNILQDPMSFTVRPYACKTLRACTLYGARFILSLSRLILGGERLFLFFIFTSSLAEMCSSLGIVVILYDESFDSPFAPAAAASPHLLPASRSPESIMHTGPRVILKRQLPCSMAWARPAASNMCPFHRILEATLKRRKYLRARISRSCVAHMRSSYSLQRLGTVR